MLLRIAVLGVAVGAMLFGILIRNKRKDAKKLITLSRLSIFIGFVALFLSLSEILLEFIR